MTLVNSDEDFSSNIYAITLVYCQLHETEFLTFSVGMMVGVTIYDVHVAGSRKIFLVLARAMGRNYLSICIVL